METVKKTPQRRCIGCYNTFDKKDLLRIVRSPDGSFNFDESGKLSGRGAYICRNTKCLDTAFKKRQLERSFSQKVSDDVHNSLKEELIKYVE